MRPGDTATHAEPSAAFGSPARPQPAWKLTDLITVSTLQSIQDTFARAFGLPTVIVDLEGANATRITHRLGFCEDLTRRSDVGGPRCQDCDLSAMHQAADDGQPTIFRCWNGLYDAAIPIAPKGKVLGYFLCGQVLTDAPDQEVYLRTANELGLDPQTYVEALNDVRVIPYDTYRASVESMHVLAEMIAEQAAAAIDNLTILEEAVDAKEDASRLIAELDNILATLSDVGSQPDYRSTLEAIADNLSRLIPYDSCLIYIFNEGTDALVPAVVRDPYPDALWAFRPQVGEGIIGKAASTGLPRSIEDVTQDPDYVEIPGAPVEPEAMLAVPMVHKQKLLGVISLSRFERRTFTPHEFKILSTLASTQAALAVENARIYDRERQLVERYRLLAELGARVVSAGSAEEVQEHLLSRTAELFGADRCFVAIPDEAYDAVHIQIREGRGHVWSLAVVPSGPGRLAAIRLHDERVPDRALFDAWAREIVEQMSSHVGVAEFIAEPVASGAGVMGGVFVAWDRRPDVPPGDPRMLQVIAGAAGATLTNLVHAAQTDPALRLKVAELERANRTAERTNRELHRLLEFQRALTVEVLDSGGLQPIARSLGVITGVEVAIIDARGGCLARYPADGTLDWLPPQHPGSPSAIVEGSVIACPAVVEGEPLAWVVASDGQLSDVGRAALDHGALLTALELLRERTALEVEVRLRGGLIEELFSGHFVEEMVIKQALSLGFDVTVPSRVIVVEPAAGDASRSDIEAIYALVAEDVSALDMPNLATVRGNSVVVLCHESAQARPEDDLSASLARRLSRPAVNIACGTVARVLAEYRDSHTAARRGLDLLRMMGRSNFVFSFRDSGIEHLLMRSTDPEIVMDFTKAFIGPLEEYDRTHSSQLRHSLETLYATGLNLEETARRLHIHVSTLRYRLKKVEQLLSVDIRGTDRLGLELALRVATVFESFQN